MEKCGADWPRRAGPSSQGWERRHLVNAPGRASWLHGTRINAPQSPGACRESNEGPRSSRPQSWLAPRLSGSRRSPSTLPAERLRRRRKPSGRCPRVGSSAVRRDGAPEPWERSSHRVAPSDVAGVRDDPKSPLPPACLQSFRVDRDAAAASPFPARDMRFCHAKAARLGPDPAHGFQVRFINSIHERRNTNPDGSAPGRLAGGLIGRAEP